MSDEEQHIFVGSNKLSLTDRVSKSMCEKKKKKRIILKAARIFSQVRATDTRRAP